MNNSSARKIGYVLKRYPRFSETFIVNEILALEAAGWDAEIFSLYGTNDTHFQEAISLVKAPVTYLSTEGLKAFEFWKELETAGTVATSLWRLLENGRGCEAREIYQAARLARLVIDRGIRHLHAHFASTATTVARLAAGFAGIQYSFTAHAKDIFHESVAREDLRRKLSDAAAVVTISDYNVLYLQREFGTAASRLQRIYNGIDRQRFVYSSPEARPPVIAAVGRLIEKKGFEVLIDACALLAAHETRFECRIIGTGERELALRARIDQLGLGTQVKMLGAKPQSQVIEQIQGAAAFVAPCVIGSDGNADGLPTVLLEAMALGTPCISTDVTGIPEVLHPEKTGLMVPQHDASALAAAIQRLWDGPALRVHLATHARRLIEREFDVRRNAMALAEVFERCIARSEKE